MKNDHLGAELAEVLCVEDGFILFTWDNLRAVLYPYDTTEVGENSKRIMQTRYAELFPKETT